MPTASDEQRAKWGEDGGPGDRKAIAYLESRGYRLLSDWTWLIPPGLEPTDDDREAVGFLIDEWDFGGFRRSTTRQRLTRQE